MAILDVKNVTKRFDGLLVLQNINIEISEGEFFVFIGPSGCGKSTLLRIMSGLERPDHGQVNFAKSVEKKDISFVFQQFALFPWLSVYENVELGLVGRGVPTHERKERVLAELTKLGLEGFAYNFPKELSGGMKQRVGIARALVTNPKIIFMDEPFSELDSFTAQNLRKELLEIWRERKQTIVMVTHIIEEALELSDRIAVMSPRPGTIETVVENKLSRPRNKRSKEFFAIEDKLYELVRS